MKFGGKKRGGGGERDCDYSRRPAGWAADVEFVADGAAETAAGDGVGGWRHWGRGSGVWVSCGRICRESLLTASPLQRQYYE